jgi:hypothetical protein
VHDGLVCLKTPSALRVCCRCCGCGCCGWGL